MLCTECGAVLRTAFGGSVMPKVPQSKWTADEKEFNHIVTMLDSKSQVLRIDGRLRFAKFNKRFTKEQLDAMWERIK